MTPPLGGSFNQTHLPTPGLSLAITDSSGPGVGQTARYCRVRVGGGDTPRPGQDSATRPGSGLGVVIGHLGPPAGARKRSLFASSPWFRGAAEHEAAGRNSVIVGPGVTAPKRRYQ